MQVIMDGHLRKQWNLSPRPSSSLLSLPWHAEADQLGGQHKKDFDSFDRGGFTPLSATVRAYTYNYG